MVKKVEKKKAGEELPKKKKAPAAKPAPKPAPEPEPETDGEERSSEPGEGALVVAGGEAAAIEPAKPDGAEEALEAAAREEMDEGEEEVAATSLGSQRYVMAGFFAAAMIGAFVFGKLVHGVWSSVSNKDWFSRALPALAAVPDEDKTTYGMVLGAAVALIAVLRTYRKPNVRAWTDDVAAELAKVKWPSKKDVSTSTIVVIAASTVATLYLALLDRLWAFVTNLVYGSGT